ncbi:uncharacterized protein PHACADRAFT_191204 [Phanerochaete carnosa HHB-10118-sp]|uniref:Uncharacterized protein n=1 Tax=Phanerochaete carnosa (strain HHB-10118-sp) TaxID=650164 RepID=K5WHS7_PHACS|nr:uncharacterized protein PHACADRAFT_191204 [Phanerochaete carnosa HHB-10118-sp]EKM58890.1 hypothetical protein PHACADRAFT_191204 [Phanerochaete carnosa HHB-10118-sp]
MNKTAGGLKGLGGKLRLYCVLVMCPPTGMHAVTTLFVTLLVITTCIIAAASVRQQEMRHYAASYTPDLPPKLTYAEGNIPMIGEA